MRFNVLRKGFKDERPVNALGHALNKPKKEALVAACDECDLPSKGTIEVLTARLVAAGVEPELLGDVSKTQPTALFERSEMPLQPVQLQTFARRLQAEALDMAAVRRGDSPIYKNPTKDCSWDCPFNQACEVHEMGGDYEGILEFDFKPWDPYTDHHNPEGIDA